MGDIREIRNKQKAISGKPIHHFDLLKNSNKRFREYVRFLLHIRKQRMSGLRYVLTALQACMKRLITLTPTLGSEKAADSYQQLKLTENNAVGVQKPL